MSEKRAISEAKIQDVVARAGAKASPERLARFQAKQEARAMRTAQRAADQERAARRQAGKSRFEQANQHFDAAERSNAQTSKSLAALQAARGVTPTGTGPATPTDPNRRAAMNSGEWARLIGGGLALGAAGLGHALEHYPRQPAGPSGLQIAGIGAGLLGAGALGAAALNSGSSPARPPPAYGYPQTYPQSAQYAVKMGEARVLRKYGLGQ